PRCGEKRKGPRGDTYRRYSSIIELSVRWGSFFNGNLEADSRPFTRAWDYVEAVGLGGFQSGFLDSQSGF
ncbi:MAG: hypothetical protein ACI8TF_002878, partial [Paracoccaceae bacterium]